MNGKGPKDNRTPNYKARRESWDRIFGKKKDENNKEWNYDKKKRELLHDIKSYEIHAIREIENGKNKTSCQRYLQTCIERYEAFTGEKYDKES